MINIIGVKSDNGYYLKIAGSNQYIGTFLVNEEYPKKTFHPYWFLSKDIPTKVEKAIRQPRINHRFELIDDTPWIGKTELPKSFPKSEVMEESSDGYCKWKDEFKHLQSLYHEVSDEQPNKIEPVEFTYKTVLEVTDLKYSDNFSYAVQRTQWSNEGTIELKNSNIINQELDKLLFPDIALPNCRSALSSKDSFNIIREHVKMNIDQRYAEITSDYNFCFEVAKVVPLANIVTNKTEIKNAKGRSYRNPRYKQFTVKKRLIKKVFEMTWAPENYGGYTPIPSFIGGNQQDLKEKIDKFLDDLMARINEPLIECQHCDGMGVVVQK